MSKSKLLQEAIADAKAVKDTALENAKAALTEAFTPKLQSMISAKLQQEMDDEDMEGEYSEEETYDEEMEDEFDAEELAPEEDEMDAEIGDEEEMSEEDEMSTDDEMSMDSEDEFSDDEEDLELEAIIKELEDEMGEEGNEDEEYEEEMEEAVGGSDIGNGDNKQPATDANSAQTEDPDKDLYEDIDINEIIAALREDDSFMGDGTPDGDADEESQEEEDMHENAQLKAELEEAYKAIKVMKSSLTETNLLNAKLLFSNKLFKAYDLNESQKLKVIDNFDRASNLKEVKLVYVTLAESMKVPAKRRVTESASKVVGSTAPSKKIISEGNENFSDRLQLLAGIKRKNY